MRRKYVLKIPLFSLLGAWIPLGCKINQGKALFLTCHHSWWELIGSVLPLRLHLCNLVHWKRIWHGETSWLVMVQRKADMQSLMYILNCSCIYRMTAWKTHKQFLPSPKTSVRCHNHWTVPQNRTADKYSNGLSQRARCPPTSVMLWFIWYSYMCSSSGKYFIPGSLYNSCAGCDESIIPHSMLLCQCCTSRMLLGLPLGQLQCPCKLQARGLTCRVVCISVQWFNVLVVGEVVCRAAPYNGQAVWGCPCAWGANVFRSTTRCQL